MSLCSEIVDGQAFVVTGLLDTYIPHSALWAIGRNEKAIFVSTIRSHADVFGIVLFTIADDPRYTFA